MVLHRIVSLTQARTLHRPMSRPLVCEHEAVVYRVSSTDCLHSLVSDSIVSLTNSIPIRVCCISFSR